MEEPIDDLRYPIGNFSEPVFINDASLQSWVNDIDAFPERLNTTVKHLSAEQLDTPYRPGGWTIRQVIHHCADSHMNSWIRFKLALTEDKPVIKPYMEDLWAELPDSKIMDIHPSLVLLKALHTKWVFLLKSLTDIDLQRVYVHPEFGKEYKLDSAIALYAWHCNHHLAHILSLKARKGWK